MLRPNNTTSTIGFGLVGINGWDYVATQSLVYLRYCKLAIWPTDLVLDYGWLPVSDPATRFLGWGVWCVWGLVIALTLRWWTAIGIALVVIEVVLAPTTFVPMQDVIYDHRMYLPLAVVCIVSVLLAGIHVSSQQTIRLLPIGLLAGVVVFSVVTVLRIQDYSTAASLAHRDQERQPSNPRSYFRIAVNDQSLPLNQRVRAMESAIALSEKRQYFYAGTKYVWPRSFADAMLHAGASSEAGRWFAVALSNSETELQEAESLWSLAMIAARDGDQELASSLFQKAIGFETRIKGQIQLTHDAYRQSLEMSPLVE
ncbi:tetratricopeptide repeat protein [Neorhodopirellula lusitana]|uniref:hypothetical protein n=1 Tax=Neorhodopirellula lusitana TaxID=445327 RepID=UPI00384C9F22